VRKRTRRSRCAEGREEGRAERSSIPPPPLPTPTHAKPARSGRAHPLFNHSPSFFITRARLLLFHAQVRDAAKAGDIAGAKALAREIVRTRAAATRLHTNKAHLIDMNARLTEQLGLVKVAGTLQKSGEVMAAVNRLVKVPQLMGTMRAMGREMARAGFIGEVMEDGLDSAAGVEGEDEAADEAVAAVLAEVAGEDVAAMAGAGAVPRAKLPGAAVAAGEEGEAEDADALELKARLEAVRS
jgi:charged multivesicular body protein 3